MGREENGSSEEPAGRYSRSVSALQSVRFPPLIADERKEKGFFFSLPLVVALISAHMERGISWTARCFSNMFMHKHAHSCEEQIFIFNENTRLSPVTLLFRAEDLKLVGFREPLITLMFIK